MDTNALLNDFAVRCFRDTADQDYIAARMLYKVRLISQFHWSSLQSIEKYLKCILLINRIKARDVNHDLKLALCYSKALPFRLETSPSTKKFIKHLDTFGRFRYLEGSFHVHGPKLVELDRSIWEIRRYCRPMSYTIEMEAGETKGMLSLELEKIANSSRHPHINSGFLAGFLRKFLMMSGTLLENR